MRILAVTPYFPPEGGGLERYAQAILAGLARRGHEVQVHAFTRTGLRGASQDGVQVERHRAPLRLGSTPIDPLLRRRLRRAIQTFRPDVVVGHGPVPFPAEMAYLAATDAGVPFVTTYHAGSLRGSSALLQPFAWFDRLTLQRRMLGGSRRLIAVGPYVRDKALADHRPRVTIVPPGVATDRFAPAGAPDGPTILFVGPLSTSYRWKGVDTLLDAFQIVRRDVDGARLRLVGDGNRFAELTRRAEREGGAVELRRRLSEPELIAEYRRAAVVTLPSTTDAEAFGMVLAEANACGRPVVASRIGGIPDFVQDGENGLLARPGDAADLAEKLVRVLRDPALAARLGARGREKVVARHDWPQLVVATEQVLQEAVASSPDPAS